jgi:hypothetical protein
LPGIGGVERSGKGVEQVVVGAKQVGLAGEDGRQVAGGHIGQQRQHLVAHAVAHESWIGVRFVVGRGHASEPTHLHGVGSTQPQEGPRGPRAHTGQTARCGTAQQVDEHGLGLVVGCVPGEHAGGQHGVARRPGPGLEIRAVAHGHRMHGAGHAEGGGGALYERRIVG